METVADISLIKLLLAFVPVLVTLVILWKWAMDVGNAVYALLRMVGQLLLVGYLLAWIFGADSSGVILLVLVVMVVASSWIALRTVSHSRFELFKVALLGISVGGGLTLLVSTQWVLQLDPWYEAQFMVPLAGMAFANAMTAVSLAGERLFAELDHQRSWQEARSTAFQAAMIPVINSLFAVGLVSLPGMMTGQILSGVSPLVAVRYQVLVMCMIFSAAGISTAIFLSLCPVRVAPAEE